MNKVAIQCERWGNYTKSLMIELDSIPRVGEEITITEDHLELTSKDGISTCGYYIVDRVNHFLYLQDGIWKRTVKVMVSQTGA